MIRGFAARATHGMLERPEMLVAEADCWMITYGSGDYEIVTLGNAFAGICRHPDRPVTYVAAMRLVRA